MNCGFFPPVSVVLTKTSLLRQAVRTLLYTCIYTMHGIYVQAMFPRFRLSPQFTGYTTCLHHDNNHAHITTPLSTSPYYVCITIPRLYNHALSTSPHHVYITCLHTCLHCQPSLHHHTMPASQHIVYITNPGLHRYWDPYFLSYMLMICLNA